MQANGCSIYVTSELEEGVTRVPELVEGAGVAGYPSGDHSSRTYVDTICSVDIYIIKLSPPDSKPRLYLNSREDGLGASEVS